MGCCHMCVGGNPQESYEKLADEMHWRFSQMLTMVGVGQSVTDERNCVRVLVSVPSAT